MRGSRLPPRPSAAGMVARYLLSSGSSASMLVLPVRTRLNSEGLLKLDLWCAHAASRSTCMGSVGGGVGGRQASGHRGQGAVKSQTGAREHGGGGE